MTEQHPLFCDPHWTEQFTKGDRVRSTHTRNVGTVVTVVTGRHLLIEWSETARWAAHVVRHSSALGLEREDAS